MEANSAVNAARTEGVPDPTSEQRLDTRDMDAIGRAFQSCSGNRSYIHYLDNSEPSVALFFTLGGSLLAVDGSGRTMYGSIDSLKFSDADTDNLFRDQKSVGEKVDFLVNHREYQHDSDRRLSNVSCVLDELREISLPGVHTPDVIYRDGARVVEIPELNEQGYNSVPWEEYLGGNIVPRYWKNGELVDLPQALSSLEILRRTEGQLFNSLKELENSSNRNTERAGHFQESVIFGLQVGEHIVLGKAFHGGFRTITGQQALDAISSLVSSVASNAIGDHEASSVKLLIMHTHPITSPLSEADMNALELIKEICPLPPGSSYEIIALGMDREDKMVFRYQSS